MNDHGWWMLCTNPDMLSLACRKSGGSRPTSVFGMHRGDEVKPACKLHGVPYVPVGRAVNALLDKAPPALHDYVHNPQHKVGWSIGVKVMAPLVIAPRAVYADDDVMFPNGFAALPSGAFATNGGMGGQVQKNNDKSWDLVGEIARVMELGDIDPYLWWDRQCDVGVWCLDDRITQDEYKFWLWEFYWRVKPVATARRDSVFFRETDQLFFTALWHKFKLPYTMRPGVSTGYCRIISKPEKTFLVNPRLHARHAREAKILHYGASSHKRRWMEFLDESLPDCVTT